MRAAAEPCTGKGLRRLLAVVTTVGALFVLAGPAAWAHGKEVSIGVSCSAPSAARPLTRACTAVLTYADGDPVRDAELRLTALREGRSDSPVTASFTPLAQPGTYSAIVAFPAYGRWRMRFVLAGSDRGAAELIDEILPPAPGASSEIRARLQVVTAFGAADMRNLALRIVHMLAAVAWFGLSAVVLAVARISPPQRRWRLLRRVAGIFPWAAGAAFAALAVSGALSAAYNAPTRAPGLYSPASIARLPFGEAYLAAFLAKMVLAVGTIVGTVALGVLLRRHRTVPVPVSGASIAVSERQATALPDRIPKTLARLAAVNLVMDVLLLVDLVVLGYLHVISHVGGASGG